MSARSNEVSVTEEISHTVKYWPIAASVLYLLLSFFLLGFKAEQLFLAALFITLYYASSGTRKFIVGMSVFIVYWVLYDYMKAFPNHLFATVHIEDLYRFEKDWFGVTVGYERYTLNEALQSSSNLVISIISALFYLMWIPVPLAFAAYLFFKNKKGFVLFVFAFFITNIIGFIIYYAYPAAPPWYVSQYGFEFNINALPSAAGLLKFDEFFGINLFSSMYSRGSNVFAAMPSLHCAYPLIVLYYGIKLKLGKINLMFALITAGIWFASVYTNHHYVVDVIAGILCAVLGIFTLDLLVKTNSINKFITRFQKEIT